MTSFLAKLVSKRILSESAQNRFGREDPYFEEIPAKDLHGNPKPHSKPKKVHRKIDTRIPESDREVLTKVKRRAYRLDNCISFCGIRFGWSSILGFIPALGDLLDLFMALMVIKTAMEVSPGKDRDALWKKMVFNIFIDFMIGLVPLLGDIADTFYRANTRNAIALEAMLKKRVEKEQTGLVAGNGTQSTENGWNEKMKGHRGSDGSERDLERGEHTPIPQHARH